MPTRSTLSPGYGSPKYSSKNRSENAPISSANAVRSPLPGGWTTAIGTPPTSIGAVDSNGPTTKATRYVDIRIVVANRTSRRPSSSDVSEVIAPFDTEVRPAGTTKVTANVALNVGSSKHGNARRASVASNCVVAIVCVVPD